MPSLETMISMLLFQPHRLVLDVWTDYFKNQKGVSVCGATTDIRQLAELAVAVNPRVIVLSCDFANVSHLLKYQAILSRCRETGFVVISGDFPAVLRKEFQPPGRVIFITRHSSLNDLGAAVADIGNGGIHKAQRWADGPCSALERKMVNTVSSLTKKELEVLDFMLRGEASRVIADSMGMAVRTVEVHRYNILKKFGCKRTVQLISEFSRVDLGPVSVDVAD